MDSPAPEDAAELRAVHEEDTRFISDWCGSTALYVMLYVTPLAYMGRSIVTGRPLTLKTTLRGAIGAGLAVGSGVSYLTGTWALDMGPERAHEVREEMRASNRRLNDKYTIRGSVLGATITPAILFKRAPVGTLILAGAAYGASAGQVVHTLKSLKEPAVSAAPGPAVSALS